MITRSGNRLVFLIQVPPNFRSIASQHALFHHTHQIGTKFTGHIAKPGEQANPIAGYYAELFAHPSSMKYSSPWRQSLSPKNYIKHGSKDATASPGIVFGSRLISPAQRRSAIDFQSTYVAGIRVPPKPIEPDNCCMSGCVNCVWDIYREDVEEWAAKSTAARQALAAQVARRSEGTDRFSQERTSVVDSSEDGSGKGLQSGPASMDDDGGGAETNWEISKSQNGDELFANIPVGIREFMRTEKMLKERILKEVTETR